MGKTKFEELAKRLAARSAELHAERGASPRLTLVRESIEDSAEGSPTRLPDWSAHQPVDVSERAWKMHKIMVIANTHGWQIAVTHFLMTKGAPYLSDLTGPQLDDLLDRMHGYVDAAETGACLEDALPVS
ncbi:hypothetical protein MKP15_04205 [Stenotrophomonas sp. Y6]|uniref:hypothetical protein n=1 Tax=Stenotrophomonas sp. Y6 TaxID=2920383 RepID=UPI001F051D60|nr:hypothetical protein [Stenotrophomonas sp. Y6]MCH1907975.1 hypothetical protein [Stenotrophomonas sp. Y6]